MIMVTTDHRSPKSRICWWALFIVPFLPAFALVGADSTPQFHSHYCGTREMTTFERELDLRRMRALFRQEDKHHNNNNNNIANASIPSARRLFGSSCNGLCKQCIEIPTYFHLSGFPLQSNVGDSSSSSSSNDEWIIPHPSREFQRLRQELANETATTTTMMISPGDRFSSIQDIYQLIEYQMIVLNRRYADTPFFFTWKNPDPTTAQVAVRRDFVFFYVANVHQSNDYVTAQHTGNSQTLNVFLLYRLCGHPFIWVESNCYTIGAATNPSYQLDNTADGVYLSYDTLTGGGYEDYDTGISLVHEVGHWLGLLHVFQSEAHPSDERDSNDDDYDPCDTINNLHGDYVDDTPFLPYPSVMLYNCSLTFYQGPGEEIPNTCPNRPGVDPVFNYMNYVGNDPCLPEGIGEFTCGQISRMYQQWMLYREHNENCGQDEMKIDLLLKLDVNHTVHAEIGTLHDVDDEGEDGKPVFDLARDMDTTFLVEPGNYTRAINFCVPNGDYVFAVTDAGRNGFQDGFIELKVNGVPIHRVDRDFGSTDCIKFGSGGKLADLKTIPQTDFGTYRYDLSEAGTAVFCSASGEMFEEPIDVVNDSFMRIKVFVKDEPFGTCINQVTELYIGVDGKSRKVYPRENTEIVRFQSELLSCGEDSWCLVEFDLALLEDFYNPSNRNGIYDTTCTARVKLGFGEGCLGFLREGGIDCVAKGSEVWANAEGKISFQMAASTARRRVSRRVTHYLGVVIFTAALGFLFR